MRRTLLVTLAALLLIGAHPANDRHVIRVRLLDGVRFDGAHVFLGVAVLGHHVGAIDSGWLVKQAGRGFLHIDWSRAGNWAGLKRTEQGPRDVSPQQLDAVVRTIESLGYPSDAIRAWRVPAPVGYDGFHDGDKVLTIGEILVDLGPVSDASKNLARWAALAESDNDPFEKVPMTNVRYNAELFFGGTCANIRSAVRSSTLATAEPLAQAIAQSGRRSARFQDYHAQMPRMLLCSEGAQPHFVYTYAAPPSSVNQNALSAWMSSQAAYAFGNTTTDALPADIHDALPPDEAAYAFALSTPYAATISEETVKVSPDALLLRFSYTPAWKEPQHSVELRDIDARIERLRSIAGRSAEVRVFDDPVPAGNVTRRVYIYLKHDFSLANALKTASGTRTYYPRTYTAFVSGCSLALKHATLRAFDAARKKAVMVASTFHEHIGALLSARVDPPGDDGLMCESGTAPPDLSAALKAAGSHHGIAPADMATVTFEATVDAAWQLQVKGATHAARRVEYRGETSGKTALESLDAQALLQAARQAVVDDSHIVSFFETKPALEAESGAYPASASETLIVMRP